MHGTANLNDVAIGALGSMIHEECGKSKTGPILDMLNERIRHDAWRQRPSPIGGPGILVTVGKIK
ncbi:MAG: hypothetical protein P8L66_06565 [Rhodospirillaceae bacterium]|nr:hypothetical protein [Rhodospirillaceae bacterium]